MAPFIDYVALLLINAMAGYFLLAYYVYSGLDDPDRAKWAPGFLMVGAISVVFGGAMTITWPIPKVYSSAFGEMSVLFGITFLGAGIAMAKGWSLRTVTCYGFFAGIAAIIVGLQIILLKLTLAPITSGIGFILSGAAGLFAAPTLALFKSNRAARTVAALVLTVTALVWASAVYPAYYAHMQTFDKWVPLVSRGAAPH